MTLFAQLRRIAIAAMLMVVVTSAQDNPSHRELKRPGMNLSQAQLRLELLQRLQQIAKDRQERGQEPFDINKLPPTVREQLDKVLKQDKQLKQQIDKENGAEQPPRPATEDSSNRPESERELPREQKDGSPTTNQEQKSSLKKLLEQFRNRQRRNRDGDNGSSPDGNDPRLQNRGDQRQPDDGTGRQPLSPNGRQPNRRGNGTPSQRPLSPDEIDGFDIGEYLKRLEKLEPRKPAAGTQPPRSRSNRNPDRTPQLPGTNNRGSNKSSKSGRNSNTPPKPSSSPLSRKTWQKMWESVKTPKNKPRSTDPNNPDAILPGEPGSNDSAAGGAPTSGAGGKGFFSDAMRRTAESMMDDLGDIMKNQKPGTQRPGQKPGAGMFKGLKDFGRKTGELFENTAGQASRGSGSGVQMPSAPDPMSLLPFLVLAILLAGGWFMLRSADSSAAVPAIIVASTAPMPRGINSRQDVIDAFHVIAADSPAVKGNWWTHSRAARALRKLMPQRNNDLSNLTRVYETARYLPPNEELTAEQLQTAREAIGRCS